MRGMIFQSDRFISPTLPFFKYYKILKNVSLFYLYYLCKEIFLRRSVGISLRIFPNTGYSGVFTRKFRLYLEDNMNFQFTNSAVSMISLKNLRFQKCM